MMPEEDRCGSCRRCLDICPTNAFPAPYRLDARRCISYLTIEHKGHIAPELRAGIGNRIFGCDDCLAVCPWNKFAQAGREARLVQREDSPRRSLRISPRLDDAAFRARFAGTPVKRTGRDRFVRNVLIAIGNSADPDLAPRLAAFSTTPRRSCAPWRCGPARDCCRTAVVAGLAAEHTQEATLPCATNGARRSRRRGRGCRMSLFVFGLGYTAATFARFARFAIRLRHGHGHDRGKSGAAEG